MAYKPKPYKPVTDPRDQLALGGVGSPGKVTLSGHDRNQKWDIKPSDGHGGATSTYKGEEVTQFTASFYLVQDPGAGIDEFAEWDTFRAKTLAKMIPATGDPIALDIRHPDLTENGIKSVTLGGVGGKAHDGKGGATVVVKFIENRPSKKKGGTPKGSKSSVAKVDPNADLKAEIAGLLKQASQP